MSLKTMTALQYWDTCVPSLDRSIQRLTSVQQLTDYIQDCCTSLILDGMKYAEVRDLEYLMLNHIRDKYIGECHLQPSFHCTLKGPYSTKKVSKSSPPTPPGGPSDLHIPVDSVQTLEESKAHRLADLSARLLHRLPPTGASTGPPKVLIEAEYSDWLRLLDKIDAYNNRSRSGSGPKGPLILTRLL